MTDNHTRALRLVLGEQGDPEPESSPFSPPSPFATGDNRFRALSAVTSRQDEMQRMLQNEAGQALAFVTPEQERAAVLASEASRETGRNITPEQVQIDPDAVSIQVDASRMIRAFKDAPATARFALSSGRAAFVKQDAEALAALERLSRNPGLRDRASSVMLGITGGALGTMAAAMRGSAVAREAYQLEALERTIRRIEDVGSVFATLDDEQKAEALDALRGAIVNAPADASIIRGLQLAYDALSSGGSIDEAVEFLRERIGAVRPATESPVFRFGDWLNRQVERLFSAPAGFEESFLYTELPRAVGSFAGFAGISLLTRGAGTFPAAAAAGADEAYSRARAAGLPHEEAINYALSGVPAGIVQVLPLEFILRYIPSPQRRRLTATIRDIILAGGAEATVETAGQIIQNYVEQAYNPDRELLDDTAMAAALGGSAGAIMRSIVLAAVPGVRRSLFRDIERFETSQQMTQVFEAIREGVSGVELRRRAPEVFREWATTVTTGTPVETVYVSPEGLRTMAQRVGDPAMLERIVSTLPGTDMEAFATAIREGRDLAIPMSTWMTDVIGTEFDTLLLPHVRFDPSQLTAFERAVEGASLQREIASIRDRVAALERGQEAEPVSADERARLDLFDSIVEQAIAIGETREAAEPVAAQYSAALARFAQRAGMPLGEFMKLYPAARLERDDGGMRIRAVAAETGPTLLEALRGLNDPAMADRPEFAPLRAALGDRAADAATMTPAELAEALGLPNLADDLTAALAPGAAATGHTIPASSILHMPLSAIPTLRPAGADGLPPTPFEQRRETPPAGTPTRALLQTVEARDNMIWQRSLRQWETRPRQMLHMGRTPTVLVSSGAAAHPLYVSGSKLETILRTRKNIFPEGLLNNLRAHLVEPLAVVRTQPREAGDASDSDALVVLDARATNGNYLVVAIGFDNSIRQGGREYPANVIRTIFDATPDTIRNIFDGKARRAYRIDFLRDEAALGMLSLDRGDGVTTGGAGMTGPRLLSYEQGVPFSAGRMVRTSASLVNIGRTLYQADAPFARDEAGRPLGIDHLPGLEKASPGRVPGVRELASRYMASRGLPVRHQASYVTVDVERAREIARLYDEAVHSPNDPLVRAAYEALAEETIAQFEALQELGLTFSWITGEDPYSSPADAIRDMQENRHLWVFPTDSGFGTLGEAAADNPLLAETDYWIDGRRARVNDLFRIVHDVFGHGSEGASFGPRGEENAWQAHVRMFSPLAARAMTSETRGQNSWVNYGPYGEQNRRDPKNTIYADQKAVLLPTWVSTVGQDADTPGPDVPVTAADLGNLRADTFLRPGWGIVTASRHPNDGEPWMRAENERLNAALRADLTAAGIPFLEVEGVYRGQSDGTSFLMVADEDTVAEFGRRYDQESVLTRRGLVYTDGQDRVVPFTGQVLVGEEATASDFYTKAGSFHFSLDLAFEDRIAAAPSLVPQTYVAYEGRPQLPVRALDGKAVLHHWSHRQLSTIDPNQQDTGPYRGSWHSRTGGPKKAFYGLNIHSDIGYRKEPMLGPYLHAVAIDPEAIYPYYQDPNNLKARLAEWIEQYAEKHGGARPGRDMINTRYEELIREAGFKGYYVTNDGKGSAPLGTVAVLFEPAEVEVSIDTRIGRVLYQSDFGSTPIFYSALTEAVRGAKQARASVRDWKNIIPKLPGVKQTEIDWIGLIDWLDSKGEDTQVGRDEIVTFLSARELEIRVDMSRPSEDARSAHPEVETVDTHVIDYAETGRWEDVDAPYYRGRALERHADDEAASFVSLHYERIRDEVVSELGADADVMGEEEAVRLIGSAIRLLFEDRAPPRTQDPVGQRLLDFLENNAWSYVSRSIEDSAFEEARNVYEDNPDYIHVLNIDGEYYDVHERGGVFSLDGETFSDLDEVIDYLVGEDGPGDGDADVGFAPKWLEYTLPRGDRDYREFLVRAPGLHTAPANLADARTPPAPFRYEAHFPGENILVHVRANSRTGPRTADGRPARTLFLEEVQSDLASAWRKAGGLPPRFSRRERLKRAEEAYDAYFRIKREQEPITDRAYSARARADYAEVAVLQALGASPMGVTVRAFDGTRELNVLLTGDMLVGAARLDPGIPTEERIVTFLRDEHLRAFENDAERRSVAQHIVHLLTDIRADPEKSRILQEAVDARRVYEAEQKTLAAAMARLEEAQRAATAAASAAAEDMPMTPFDSVTAYELALKTMLRWAVENNYDALAWTPGYMQATRWSGAVDDVIRTVSWLEVPAADVLPHIAAGIPGRDSIDVAVANVVMHAATHGLDTGADAGADPRDDIARAIMHNYSTIGEAYVSALLIRRLRDILGEPNPDLRMDVSVELQRLLDARGAVIGLPPGALARVMDYIDVARAEGRTQILRFDKAVNDLLTSAPGIVEAVAAARGGNAREVTTHGVKGTTTLIVGADGTILSIMANQKVLAPGDSRQRLLGRPLSAFLEEGGAQAVLSEPSGWRGGLNIIAGGSGYRIAYDQTMRKFIEKWAKRYGGKLTVTEEISGITRTPAPSMIEATTDTIDNVADMRRVAEITGQPDLVDRALQRALDEIDADLANIGTEAPSEIVARAQEQERRRLERIRSELSSGENLTIAGNPDAFMFLRRNFRKLIDTDRVINNLSELGRQVRAFGEAGFGPRPVWYVELTDKMREAARGRQPLFQTEPRRRGQIVLPPRGEAPVITLFSQANLSTMLHEMGHHYLYILQDMVLTGIADAETTKDWNTIRGWWRRNAGRIAEDARAAGAPQATEADVRRYLDTGTTGDGALDDAIGVGLHETWARGFEAYLREGRAPTVGLRGAFRRFGAWLKGLYREAERLRVNIDPEIRDVFDRLFATEQELEVARGDRGGIGGLTAASAEQLGITPEAWARLKAMEEDALAEQEQEAMRLIMQPLSEDVRRAREAEAERIRPGIEERIAAQPVYRLFDMLANGIWRGSDETPPDLRLNRDEIVAAYGEQMLKLLPRGKRAIFAKDGAPIEEVAELFGFGSADQMIQALQHMVPFEAAVQAEVDAKVADAVPDPMTTPDVNVDGAMEEALHGEQTAQLVEAEMRALRDGGAKGEIPKRQVLREAARRIIAAMPVREALRAGTYLAAERRAAREAYDALQQGDRQRALDAKRRQLQNMMLYAEAMKARELVGKIERRVARLRKSSVRERLAGDYLEAIDEILTTYEFRKVSGRELDRRGALLRYVQRMKDEGRENELAIPPEVLERAERINYRQLTVEELSGVLDALINIEHTARWKKKLRDARETRELDEVVGEVVASFRTNVRTASRGRVRSPKDIRRQSLRGYLSLVLNTSTVLRTIDGFADLGPAYRHIKARIDTATRDLTRRQEELADRLEKLYSRYSRSEMRRMATRKHRPAVGEELSHWDIISIALNMGNLDNLQRLTDPEARGFTMAQVRELVSELTDRDWDFVQGMWDLIDSYWGEIAARERRTTGVIPKKVEPVPFETPSGRVMRGGYYPIMYDGDLSAQVTDEQTAELMKNVLPGRFGKAQTAAGHLITRKRGSGGRALMLGIEVAHRHLARVIHDLAMSEAVTATWRVLQDSRVRAEFQRGGMLDDLRTLELWVQDVATGQIAAQDVMSRVLRRAKTNFTLSRLAFNLTTVAVQLTGLGQSAVVVGKKPFAVAYMRYLKSPRGTVRAVLQASDFMRRRQTTFNKDIHDILGDVTRGPLEGTYSSVMRKYVAPASFFLMQKIQFYAVDMPTWVAAYESAREQGMSEADAVIFADDTVVRAQAGGEWSDRSAFERGTINYGTRQSDFIRLFTTLGSYMFAKLNVATARTRQMRRVMREGTAGEKLVEAFRYASDMTLLFVLEGLLYAFITGRLPGEDSDEPEKEWAKFIARETLFTYAGTLPILRDLTGPMSGFAQGGAYGSITEAITRPTLAVARDMERGEMSAGTVRALIGAIGLATGLPSTATNRVIDAAWRQSEGEDVSPLEYLFGRRN